MLTLERAYAPDSPIPETVVWRVFECLAKGLLMLEKGVEDPTETPWEMDPIGHFDIKPENSASPQFENRMKVNY
jgi:hypothetical protein